MRYVIALVVAGGLAVCVTPAVIRLARRFHVVDEPNEPRKIHAAPTALLGGIAPFLGLAAGLGLFWWLAPELLRPEIPAKHLWGLMVAGAILIFGGAIDDKKNLRPSVQILFPILAAMVVIVSGIGIREITNPFGGVIRLDGWEQTLFSWQGIPYRLTLPADLFTFAWLMGMMYTTKILDGLDGLVSGLTVIGGLLVLFFTTTTQWYQPEVGVLAALIAGAFLGFLWWNFHPAKIFLGTGGSTLAGFLLGVLAIISGGKIATTLLVVGIPILDAAWVIGRRVFWEGRSPAAADRKHLHFRLLDVGFSHRGAVIVLYVIALLFGITTLVLQSREKLVALGILIVLMVVGAVVLVQVAKRKERHE